MASFQGNVNPLLALLTGGQNAATGIGQGGYNSAVNAGNAIAQGTIGAGAQEANTFNSLLGLAKAGAGIYGAMNTPTGTGFTKGTMG